MTGRRREPWQPAVRGNDWTALSPPALGRWQPNRTVSVVVGAEPGGPWTSRALAALAALAEQTYPAHLMEVLVVTDGDDRRQLPDRRPERTRLVSVSAGPRPPAHPLDVGAGAAEGEVLHWLHPEAVPQRDEVEAQLRWHHLVDYAVVVGTLTPGTERGLPAHPARSYLLHSRGCASVGQELYHSASRAGAVYEPADDLELGYRLAQRGGLFVPDEQARARHLGRRGARRRGTVDRPGRHLEHRSYAVPRIEVVVDVEGHTVEAVRSSVDGVLGGSVPDVEVVLLGPWWRLRARRFPGPADERLRQVREEHGRDPRVRFADSLEPTAFPAAYRLLLPAGWSPGHDSARRLAVEMARRDRGLVTLLLPDGSRCRLERTSAFGRALRLGPADPAHLDDLVDEVSATWWFDGVEEGFTHHSDGTGGATTGWNRWSR